MRGEDHGDATSPVILSRRGRGQRSLDGAATVKHVSKNQRAWQDEPL